MVLLYRAWNNGRNPQTDRVERDVVQSMIEDESVVFACFLSKVDGFPTASHIIKGSTCLMSKHYEDAKEAAQEMLG